jgi:hypothetical protein
MKCRDVVAEQVWKLQAPFLFREQSNMTGRRVDTEGIFKKRPRERATFTKSGGRLDEVNLTCTTLRSLIT